MNLYDIINNAFLIMQDAIKSRLNQMKHYGKKPLFILVIFLFAAISSYTQMRDDITIYIPQPTGGTYEQQEYFFENFVMETEGAGYAVTNLSAGSDYTLNLNIKPNLITYTDGTTEQAPWYEPQFVLAITLLETESRVDIVYFEFPFTTLPEMYDYNLYLIYQAMANVPLTKLTSIYIPDDDRWRNKWLYLRVSLDYNVPVYTPDEDFYKRSNPPGEPISQPIPHLYPMAPGATLGLELQFLNFMSAEAALAILLGNVTGLQSNHDIIATFDLSLRFVIKPGIHFMIEPFIGVSFPMALVGSNMSHFGILGGVEVGIKAGDMGALFFNVRGEYDLDKTTSIPPGAVDSNLLINWTRFAFGVGVGYKIGFSDRPVRE